MISSNSKTDGEDATALVQRRLTIEPGTPETLASMGTLIGGPAVGTARLSHFYEQAVRVQPVAFRSELAVELSLCTIEPRTLSVRWMERHFRHTQTFLPLGGKPFLMVLAPPTETDLPDPESVRAFRFDGTRGVMLHVGAWHEFPFAEQAATQIAVLLTRAATEGLEAKNIVAGEGYSDDLEKKDVTRRLGVQWLLDTD